MINLKSMYKNGKHKVLMRTFLFLVFAILSFGVYFCIAPKNEVNADNDVEYSFKINFERRSDGSPDVFAGNINVSYVVSGAPAIENPGTLTIGNDGSYTFKVRKSEIGNDTSGYFEFKFIKDNNCDLYDHIDAVYNGGYKIDNETMRSNDGWADNEGGRRFTVEFAYPDGAPYYTKAIISGSGRSAFMSQISLYDRNFYAADTDGDGHYDYPQKKAFNVDKGIIIWESKSPQDYRYKFYRFAYTGADIYLKDIYCLYGYGSINNLKRSNQGFSGYFSLSFKREVTYPNLYSLNLEYNSNFDIILQSDSAESRLGKHVKKCSTTQIADDNFFDSKSINIDSEDVETATINTRMFDSVSYQEVTLEARPGEIISNVEGPNVESGEWNSENKTYTFKINGRPGSSAVYTVKNSSHKCNITLTGPGGTSPYENQEIGNFVDKVQVYRNSIADENLITTADEISDGAENIVLNEFNVDPDSDSIIIRLMAKVGMKMVNVSGKNTQGGTWDDAGKVYTFTIDSYPGENETYTVEGGLLGYPLHFKLPNDVSSDEKFKVYTGSEPADWPSSVSINYNTDTFVYVKLGAAYTNSPITLTGKGKFENPAKKK